MSYHLHSDRNRQGAFAALLSFIRSKLQPTFKLTSDQYLLAVDTWEGQGQLNFADLEAGGVSAAFVRLNDILGGTHKDTLFDATWKIETPVIKVPYFVYNPWDTGQKNFDWLLANAPADMRAVAIDLEVIYNGYNPATYAQQVEIFLNLARTRWHVINYTAEWFLPNLSYWVKDVPYWWAQYPFGLYTSMTITWNRMRELLLGYSAPSNASKCPGNIKVWQCSGDRITLPGSSKPIDVDVLYMTLLELKSFAGVVDVPPEPEPTPIWTEERYQNLLNRITGIQISQSGRLDQLSLQITNQADDILYAINQISVTPPSQPPSVSDGYKGPTLGIYEIISTGTDSNSFQIFDGDGGYSTVMQERTVDYLKTHLLGWDELVHPAGTVKPTYEEKNMRWYFNSKAILGAKVRVAEIVSGRARIVGMDADGDPYYCAVNLGACNPEKTPEYFHKIPNVPREIGIVQPRGNDASGFKQCWYIPASQLKRVS